MTVRFDRARLRLGDGRNLMLSLLEDGFLAVDPDRLVRSALSLEADVLGAERVWVLALGKASLPMARAAAASLGSRLAGGIAIAPTGYGGEAEWIRVFEARHPVPDEGGRVAAAAVEHLAAAVGERDVVLCLLSGGGSALLASPPPDVSLEDLASMTRLLLASGATIDEVNTVRRHVSALQGGGLARLLHPTSVRTLILSDVVAGRRESIASGPTVPDPTTFGDAAKVLRQYRLWEAVPRSIRAHIRRGLRGDERETAKPGDVVFRTASARLLADNGTFVDAVCAAGANSGLAVVRIEKPITGEARDAGRCLGERVVELARTASGSSILVGGGETTVTVRGDGRGGRNQETALAAATVIDGRTGVALASLATDGVDGPTDAAGGIVDGETIALAGDRGFEPGASLEENDAYPLLAATDDLLFTGPTRTNVADIFAALVDPARR